MGSGRYVLEKTPEGGLILHTKTGLIPTTHWGERSTGLCTLPVSGSLRPVQTKAAITGIVVNFVRPMLDCREDL